MQNAPIVDVVNNTAGRVDPSYLNLDYFFSHILYFLTNIKSFFVGSGGSVGFLSKIKFFSSFVCVIFIVIILYCLVRLWEKKIEQEKKSKIEKLSKEADQKQEEDKISLPFQNERWEKILSHSNTENPNDWKIAIIDADNMLDDLTVNMRLKGENLGERLKSADRNTFKNLDNAWEAHKVRNSIAHDTLYELSLRETRRAVDCYRQVFEEFGMI